MGSILRAWGWIKRRGLSHAVVLALGIALAMGWAYWHGKRVAQAQADVAAITQQKEIVHADATKDREAARTAIAGTQPNPAHDYFMELCRRARAEAGRR